MMRHQTDAALTRILGPDKEQRSWASLLNPGGGAGLPPAWAQQPTAFRGNSRLKTSPHIRMTVAHLPDTRTTYLTSPPIPILIFTPRSISMMLQHDQSRRIYNPNKIPRYRPSHSTMGGGVLPQTPTRISLHLPTPPVNRRHLVPTLTSILQSSPDHL